MDELKIIFRKLNSKPIVVQPLYIDLAGSITAGMMLSQMVYWWYAMDEKPFWKTNEDWQHELRMGRDELLLAKKNLRKLKFIKMDVKGAPPKTYFSIDTEALIKALVELSEPEFSIVGKPNNQSSEEADSNSRETQQLKVGKPDNSYTESTSEKLASELGKGAAPEIPAEEGGALSGTNARSAFRSALDSLLDCGDALETLTAKNKARVVLGFYDRVATHKKLTNGGSVKLLEVIQKSLEKGVDAEEMIHAMWRLQHCSFATDGLKWKNKWDLYYLLERKQQDKVDVALNKFSPDTATLDEQWSAIQPFQRLLSSPLTRYVRPAQSQSGGKDYSALARKPAGIVGAAK